MEIKIEKGIPCPGPRATEKNKIFEALEQLEVGDSFLWPSGSYIRKYGRQTNRQFCCRKEGKQYRIWRVA